MKSLLYAAWSELCRQRASTDIAWSLNQTLNKQIKASIDDKNAMQARHNTEISGLQLISRGLCSTLGMALLSLKERRRLYVELFGELRVALAQRNAATSMLFLALSWGVRLLCGKQTQIQQLNKAVSMLHGIQDFTMSRLHRHQYLLDSYRDKVIANDEALSEHEKEAQQSLSEHKREAEQALFNHKREARQELSRSDRRVVVLSRKNQVLRKTTRGLVSHDQATAKQLSDSVTEGRGLREAVTELRLQAASTTQRSNGLILAVADLVSQRKDMRLVIQWAMTLLVSTRGSLTSTEEQLKDMRTEVASQSRQLIANQEEIEDWRASDLALTSELEEAGEEIEAKAIDITVLENRVQELTDEVMGEGIVAQGQRDHMKALRLKAKTAVNDARILSSMLVQSRLSHTRDLVTKQAYFEALLA
ncbi:hypothetical protein Slin14017_G022060 [Septoria linicola]|nr:hypothetical protein Slin14017_G022060 [Septoria linicola]